VLENRHFAKLLERYMLCLDKHTAEKPTQKFILFLPNLFLPTLISTFCIFPKRKPTQKMQKELIFTTLKIQ
jgi:hypothetical protein